MQRGPHRDPLRTLRVPVAVTDDGECGARRSPKGAVVCWLPAGHEGPHLGAGRAGPSPWFSWPNENEKEKAQ